MARVRVSTTVDADLLHRARVVHGAQTDASLVEAALMSLLDSHRRAEVDAAYDRAYGAGPTSAASAAATDAETTDAWGDLAAWRAAVSAP
jgi:hypothetical protein